MGQTAMFVSIDEKPSGLLGVADPIYHNTDPALASLRVNTLPVRLPRVVKSLERRNKKSYSNNQWG